MMDGVGKAHQSSKSCFLGTKGVWSIHAYNDESEWGRSVLVENECIPWTSLSKKGLIYYAVPNRDTMGINIIQLQVSLHPTVGHCPLSLRFCSFLALSIRG